MKLYKIAESKISIDTSQYIESAKSKIDSYIDLDLENYHRLQGFQFNPEEIVAALQAIRYPNVDSVTRFIQTKDVNLAHDAIMGIFEWWKQNKTDPQLWSKISPVVKALNDYEDVISGNKITWTEEFGAQKLRELTSQTKKNMERIKANLTGAITRIPNWNDSFITIKASELYDDSELIAQNSATIEIGQNEGGMWKPSFSYFVSDDGIEIDDVLEGGDEDFFTDNKVQSDYFNLINAIRNPNMSAKSKVVTLYTARPYKDRDFYLKTKVIPINIFLTSSYNFAEGFAREYGGEKDIWKVRIKDKYLVKTMDSPEQKQYQAIGDNSVPVESIELITPWDTIQQK